MHDARLRAESSNSDEQFATPPKLGCVCQVWAAQQRRTFMARRTLAVLLGSLVVVVLSLIVSYMSVEEGRITTNLEEKLTDIDKTLKEKGDERLALNRELEKLSPSASPSIEVVSRLPLLAKELKQLQADLDQSQNIISGLWWKKAQRNNLLLKCKDLKSQVQLQIQIVESQIAEWDRRQSLRLKNDFNRSAENAVENNF
jgi:hypothetical protein